MIGCRQDLLWCDKDHFTLIKIKIALSITYFLLNVIFKPDRIEIESDAGAGGFVFFDLHIFQIDDAHQWMFGCRKRKPAMQFSNGSDGMYSVATHFRKGT